MGVGDLSAREIRSDDIESIADYWSTSTPEHLLGMGVDLAKMFSRSEYIEMLTSQLDLAPERLETYYTVWEVDGRPIGHCNVNRISFGDEAYMHLHLWPAHVRHRGYGVALIRRSLPYFFNRLQLCNLYCEPYAKNRAPHRALEKAGFEFVKTHRTVPGRINFEQDVHLWHMSRAKFDALIGQTEADLQ